jgi:RND family efflux transporter MFP subunit
MAERDLKRTEPEAPFNGRVRRENVDIGQYVARGSVSAQLYSIDTAEIRLPLPNEDLAYVDIPLSYRNGSDAGNTGPEVLLRADWAGKKYTWQGRIVRTEGEIDANTRMLYAVAEVEDPYAHGEDPNRPPLSVGMFVRAEILGNSISDVFVLPRAAIRGSDTVYIVDREGKLHFRQVAVYKRERESVIIRSGLEAGERVCISPLETVVDGMEVRRISEEATP